MNTVAATGTNCYQHTKPARVGGKPVGRAGIGRTPAAKILRSPLWQNDSGSVKKLLTFMSRHTADIAGLYIPWPIEKSLFPVLASESGVRTANNHVWHMEMLAGICDADPDLLLAAPFRVVDLTDKADQEKGIRWWEELAASGGEGMVVKPLEFVTKGRKGAGATCR